MVRVAGHKTPVANANVAISFAARETAVDFLANVSICVGTDINFTTENVSRFFNERRLFREKFLRRLDFFFW
jgi:hypothetical protein